MNAVVTRVLNKISVVFYNNENRGLKWYDQVLRLFYLRFISHLILYNLLKYFFGTFETRKKKEI